MSVEKIAIIGGGNLGSAIATGLLNSHFTLPENLLITKRNIASLDNFSQKGVKVTQHNADAFKFAKWIILAVKPFQYKAILEENKHFLNEGHIIISVVSGVWIKSIQEIVGKSVTIYRAMPNTAIAIQQSMTCICTEDTNKKNIDFVNTLFDALGKSIIIDESLMDAATVLGACGTAFAMRFIRANIQGGIEIGFSSANASLIAAQTIKGAAELLLTLNTHPEQEIDKVTTPKGCTIAGLNEMEHQGFSSSLIKGITASYKKIIQG